MASAAELGNQANAAMVDRLIAEGALWSPPLIAAFRATPRHRFLPKVYQFSRRSNGWRAIDAENPGPEVLKLLYSDRALITHLSPPGPQGPPVPISSSSQPSLMAQMLEDLKLSPGLKVLEIGAGTGYNAALLAHVVGPGLVTTIDVDRRVLAEAWDHLQDFPERALQLRHADGREGFAESAPYDRIMVTAATADLAPAWLEQLAEGGLLLAPWSLVPGLAYTVRGTVRNGVFDGRLTRAAYFMPLRAEDETGLEEIEPFPPIGELRTLPAPWAGWFDRRRVRLGWLGFSQAQAFFAWVRGLNIHYRTADNGMAIFGVSQPQTRDLCWLGHQEWQVTGDSGRDLAWELWRAFLEAGGPWPTEFRVQAVPSAAGAKVLKPDRAPGFLHQGARCQYLWEIVEPRERLAWF